MLLAEFKTPWNFLAETNAEARSVEATSSVNQIWWTLADSPDISKIFDFVKISRILDFVVKSKILNKIGRTCQLLSDSVGNLRHCPENKGGPYRTRTCHLLIANEAL